MSKIILDLCGGTGAWSKPYKEAGYDVRVITYPEHDILTYKPPENVYGILAAPPCTMFSIARNDKTAKEKRDFESGLEIVNAVFRIVKECRLSGIRRNETSLKFWALENPSTGYLQDFIGKPCYTFSPFEFGDNHNKRTGLWGYFNEPKKIAGAECKITNSVKFGNSSNDLSQSLHLIPDGYRESTGYDTRKILRSITPQGFANAFFKENQ